MKPQPQDPNERVYFYQEDFDATIEYPEPNLPEPESPWRRVYGPALNSNLLDRGFLYGAIGLAAIWLLTQYFSNSALLIDNLSKCLPQSVAYCAIIAFFLGGELDRRDQEAPFGKIKLDPLKKVSFLKVPLVILGGVLAVAWLILYRYEIWVNLELISSNWIPILAAGLILALSSIAIIKWGTRKSKPYAIV